MRTLCISLSAFVGTALIHLPASAQAPEGLLKQDAASTGQTTVTTETFEAGAKPPDESKDDAEMSVSAGGFFSAGNTRSESITSSTQFKLRRGDNQAAAATAVNFGQAAPNGEDLETTVENFQGRVRYDRFLTESIAAFIGVSGRRDRFQGLALRLNIDPGFAYYFVDVENHQLWGELGYDLQYDIRTSEAIANALAQGQLVDDTATRHSGRLFAGYENRLNAAVSFNTGLEYIQSVQETKNWRLNWDWGLTSTITGRLAAATTFTFRYDNNPLPGVEPVDVVTAVSLVLTVL